MEVVKNKSSKFIRRSDIRHDPNPLFPFYHVPILPYRGVCRGVSRVVHWRFHPLFCMDEGWAYVTFHSQPLSSCDWQELHCGNVSSWRKGGVGGGGRHLASDSQMGKSTNQLAKNTIMPTICLFGVDVKDHLDNSPTVNSSVISDYLS